MKTFLSLTCAAAALSAALCLGGCAAEVDYTEYVSEYRAEIYRAEGDGFALTAFFGEREYPYAADGVCAAKEPLAEIYMTAPDNTADYTLSFTVGNAVCGGDMSFDAAHARFCYSESVECVSAPSLTFTVTYDGQKTVLEAASVRTGKEMTMPEILGKLNEQRPALLSSMTQHDAFDGELCVRLVYNQKCYYFVGVISPAGKSDYFLLDGETGEIRAERRSG